MRAENQKEHLTLRSEFLSGFIIQKQNKTILLFLALQKTLLKFGKLQVHMEILLLLTLVLFFCSSNHRSQGFSFVVKA